MFSPEVDNGRSPAWRKFAAAGQTAKAMRGRSGFTRLLQAGVKPDGRVQRAEGTGCIVQREQGAAGSGARGFHARQTC